jgi:hypothetical protein
MLEWLLLVAFFIVLWKGVDWLCREWETILDNDCPIEKNDRENIISNNTPISKYPVNDNQLSSSKLSEGGIKKTRGNSRGSKSRGSASSKNKGNDSHNNNKKRKDTESNMFGNDKRKDQVPDHSNPVSRVAGERDDSKGGESKVRKSNTLYIP